VKFFTVQLSQIILINLYEVLNNPEREVDIAATLIKLPYNFLIVMMGRYDNQKLGKNFEPAIPFGPCLL